MNIIFTSLREQAERNINIRVITNNQFQVWLPIYYEDGDMIDIYVEVLPDNTFRITDAGMTIMKLTYTYEINTENKRKMLQEMIQTNGLYLENGVISCLAHYENLYRELIRFGNTIIRISTMSYLRREIVKNLFYDLLDDVIDHTFSAHFDISKQYYPLDGKEEYMVDYRIARDKAIFLYGVKDTSKARLVTICEQTFKLQNLLSESVVVYDDFLSLSGADQVRIMNATDKQFPSLPDFQESGFQYLLKRTG